VSKSADDNKKELMDEYKTTSKRLQNYVIIFLGFLFLIFFLILFLYYFLTDSYKLAQNMKFYSDKIYENFDLNRHILQDYKQYNEGTKKLLNNVTTYTNVLEKVKQLYNDTQYTNEY
jgi:predicted PurR-regulated permease PerM